MLTEPIASEQSVARFIFRLMDELQGGVREIYEVEDNSEAAEVVVRVSEHQTFTVHVREL